MRGLELWLHLTPRARVLEIYFGHACPREQTEFLAILPLTVVCSVLLEQARRGQNTEASSLLVPSLGTATPSCGVDADVVPIAKAAQNPETGETLAVHVHGWWPG